MDYRNRRGTGDLFAFTTDSTANQLTLYFESHTPNIYAYDRLDKKNVY